MRMLNKDWIWLLRDEKKWRSRATTWCDSHMSPSIRMDQLTPMRRILITPCWTMIIGSNKVISTYRMTACNNMATQSYGVLRFNTTCLLALSTLIRTESTSWTVTRRALALAWAFFLYCWRVRTFRLCFRCEPGMAMKVGIW